MDNFLDEEFALNSDDEASLRLGTLALTFLYRSTALDSSTIHRLIYSDLAQQAFEKAFSRDRERLAQFGVYIEPADASAGEQTWLLDKARSTPGKERFDAQEAIALCALCRPFVFDASFPYADELRVALTKISHSFDSYLPHFANSQDQPHTNEALLVAREALDKHCGMSFAYTNQAGETKDKRIAVYGMFGLLNRLYITGPEIDEQAQVDDTPKTYRLDRIENGTLCPDISYSIPADFYIDDYDRLPFQIGDASFEASFLVPQEREQDLRLAVGQRGTWNTGDRLRWSANAHSVESACAWAIEMGIVPECPDELVEAYANLLREVCEHAN